MTQSRPLSTFSSASTDVDVFAPATLPRIGPFPLDKSSEPTVDPENGVVQKKVSMDSPPEGGLQGWLTVLGSFCITTAVYGLSNSVGVIQPYWAQYHLSSFAVQDIAWISGANIFLCLFLGVQVGPWFDRFGPRWLLMAGSLIYMAGLIGLGFLPEDSDVSTGPGIRAPGTLYGLLMLLWGIIMGSGAALCCTVALSVLAHWFEKKRGLAAGIVFVGSSVGGAVFPLVLRTTLPRMGWAWSMRILALIVASLLGMGNILIKGRIQGRHGAGAINFGCFRDASFVWTTVGCFSSGVGRLAAGAISDKIGRFNTMILTTIFSIVTTFAVWLLVETHRMWLLYLFAALFGFGTGCVISIGPICVGQ
ncbi:major facilitator superfamily domain-containing protein [Apiosordaria backusii]|uniref:Major facilitator superfamily domain-containing protein n=1 Tax=Apiosordaria backusii TaxID=314023 RepID=A0AA40DS71_9PEZI|nr:major facilitator superfamily domain-containing protein [Apiosordaria backusii]